MKGTAGGQLIKITFGSTRNALKSLKGGFLYLGDGMNLCIEVSPEEIVLFS